MCFPGEPELLGVGSSHCSWKPPRSLAWPEWRGSLEEGWQGVPSGIPEPGGMSGPWPPGRPLIFEKGQ